MADHPNLDKAFEEMVLALSKPDHEILKSLESGEGHLLHMLLGVSGEVGELTDAIKKHIMYRKPIDMGNIVEELGDIEFYLEGLRQALGVSREETLKLNLEKLLTGKQARYASGEYSNQQAQNRADKQ